MVKRVEDSKTEHVQILSQDSLNGYRRLFGGKLMQWIDIVAAVTAKRHSGRNVTTACVDSLDFKAPAYANDTLVLIGYITYTGKTSMEVCVKTYVEGLDGKRCMINEAYIIMVALDQNETPTAVPKLLLETEEEKNRWEEALARKEARRKRKQKNPLDRSKNRL